MAAPGEQIRPAWGGNPPSATFANGGSLQPERPGGSRGPGQTMPAGSYGSRGLPSWGGASGWQAKQLAQNEASGQPVEVSPGVWVYPNGQPVTGEQLEALNSASTVLPASANAENNTILAEEQALASQATMGVPAATSTSFLTQSTIFPPHSNGQVLALGGGALLVLYFAMRRR